MALTDRLWYTLIQKLLNGKLAIPLVGVPRKVISDNSLYCMASVVSQAVLLTIVIIDYYVHYRIDAQHNVIPRNVFTDIRVINIAISGSYNAHSYIHYLFISTRIGGSSIREMVYKPVG